MDPSPVRVQDDILGCSRGCQLQAFCNLDGVESSTLADLVANNPNVHAVFAGEVFADTANVNVVGAHEVERHRIDVVCRIVAKLEAFAVLDSIADFFDGKSAFRFEADSFGMAAEGRNADAGSSAANVTVHDLLRFVEHLHFFLRVAKAGENILIETTDTPDELSTELIKAVAKAGGNAFVHNFNSRVRREMIRSASDEQMKLSAELAMAEMQKMQAYLSIRAMNNAMENCDIDDKKMLTYRTIMQDVLNYRVNNTRWCVLRRILP